MVVLGAKAAGLEAVSDEARRPGIRDHLLRDNACAACPARKSQASQGVEGLTSQRDKEIAALETVPTALLAVLQHQGYLERTSCLTRSLLCRC